MKYYDRTRELAFLKDIQKKAFGEFSKMTVLKGRRRIGKTTLGILSMEGTDTVYLFVARKAEADLCSEYAETILGLRPLSYKVPRMALPSIQMMSVAEADISLRKTSAKADIRSAIFSSSML